MIDSFFLLFFCFCPSIYFSDSTEPSNRISHWETSHLKFKVQSFESSTILLPEFKKELKCFHKAFLTTHPSLVNNPTEQKEAIYSTKINR